MKMIFSLWKRTLWNRTLSRIPHLACQKALSWSSGKHLKRSLQRKQQVKELNSEGNLISLPLIVQVPKSATGRIWWQRPRGGLQEGRLEQVRGRSTAGLTTETVNFLLAHGLTLQMWTRSPRKPAQTWRPTGLLPPMAPPASQNNVSCLQWWKNKIPTFEVRSTKLSI